MPNYYSLIQLAPHRPEGERINLGFMVFDGDRGVCKFTRKTKTIARRCGCSVDLIDEIISGFDQVSGSLWSSDALLKPTIEDVSRAAEDWQNLLRLSEPRASMRDFGSLLAFCEERYLDQSVETRSEWAAAYKRTAIESAKGALFRSVNRHNAEKLRVLGKADSIVPGEKVLQHFDYGLKNGSVRVVGFGIAYHNAQRTSVRREIDSSALAIEDVMKHYKEMRFCIVGVGDVDDESELVQRTRKLIEGTPTTFLREGDDIEAWAEREVLAAM